MSEGSARGLTIRDFDPASASAEDWAAFHEFRRARHQEAEPEDPFEPNDVSELHLRQPEPGDERSLRAAFDSGRIAGLLRLSWTGPESPEYESWAHLLWADGWVLEPHRGRGLGRLWLAETLAAMERTGTTTVSSNVEQPGGHDFLRRVGAEPKFTERRSRLDLRRLDWDLVARWVAEGPARAPDIRLEMFPDRFPDDRIEELSGPLTELLNTMPWEGMEHGELVYTPERLRFWFERLTATGELNHTLLALEPGGGIAGMTDVAVRPRERIFIHQNFTGVHPRARGRGLGRWLKAAMLEFVRQRHPDAIWFTTENAVSNRHMLAINEALGFQPHRTDTTYQMSRERLAEAVRARPSPLS